MHDVFFGDGQVTKHTWILAVQSTYEFSGSPMKSRFTAVSTLQKRVWRLGWDYKTHQDLQIATFRYKSLCNSLQIAIGFFLDFVLSFLVGVVCFLLQYQKRKPCPGIPDVVAPVFKDRMPRANSWKRLENGR